MKKVKLNIFFLLFMVLLAGTIFAVEDKTADESTTPDSVSFEMFAEGQEYGDILKMPEEWIDRARGIVAEFIEVSGVSDIVVDYGIVGSFVYGCARGPEDPDPSDIDFIIFFKVADIYDLPHETRVTLFQGRTNWYQRFYDELDTDLNIDFLMQDSTQLKYEDTNGIFYSLRDKKMYGRDDGKPFFGRLIWFEGNWYRVDRPAYDKLCVEHPKDQNDLIMQLGENGKVQFIDLNSGEVLLESE